jgi:hypothetical protein
MADSSRGEGEEATGANKAVAIMAMAGGVITPIAVSRDREGVSDAPHSRTRGIMI